MKEVGDAFHYGCPVIILACVCIVQNQNPNPCSKVSVDIISSKPGQTLTAAKKRAKAGLDNWRVIYAIAANFLTAVSKELSVCFGKTCLITLSSFHSVGLNRSKYRLNFINMRTYSRYTVPVDCNNWFSCCDLCNRTMFNSIFILSSETRG